MVIVPAYIARKNHPHEVDFQGNLLGPICVAKQPGRKLAGARRLAGKAATENVVDEREIRRDQDRDGNPADNLC